MGKKWTLYIKGLTVVVILTIILFVLDSHFESATWNKIITYFGFSFTFFGVLLTIWLYQFVTYDDVSAKINQEKYLTTKGLKELKSSLQSFIRKLKTEENFSTVDISKEIYAIRHYYEMVKENPRSILSADSFKRKFALLVSSINKNAIERKKINEIDQRIRNQLIGEASDCIRIIQIISEGKNDKAGGV